MLSQQQQQEILRPLSTGSKSSRVSRGSSTSPGPVTFHPSPVVKKPVTPQNVTLEKTASDMSGGGGGGGDQSVPGTAGSRMRFVLFAFLVFIYA
jgi:hypothetical protein